MNLQGRAQLQVCEHRLTYVGVRVVLGGPDVSRIAIRLHQP